MGTKAPNSDAVPASRPDTEGEVALGLGYLYNPGPDGTWQRVRNNVQFTIASVVARTTTLTVNNPYVNYNARGVCFYINVTANPGAQTLTPSIEALDSPISSTPATIATFATIGGNLARYYMVYPGAVESIAIGNLEVQGVALPRYWRFTMTHSGAGAWSYTVSANLIL